jgi:ethanolamine ammonia-lyase small subunit
MKDLINTDPWQTLRRFTPARIALGHVGDSLPTQAVLEFGLAHAQARDAVHVALDVPALTEQLQTAGYKSIEVRSAASTRDQYLRRPDLGRRLHDDSRESLLAAPCKPQLAIVIADGLSSTATLRHSVAVLQAIRDELGSRVPGFVVLAEQARVALGDEIGERLGAEQMVLLIGERPGLSAPDSLSIYLTYGPRVGRIDAERNCISNIRLDGLSYQHAARRLAYLIDGAQRLGYSGVRLKDESNETRLAD